MQIGGCAIETTSEFLEGNQSVMTTLSNLKARLEGLRKRDEGFTLIELLVVVIIIGILAAIAVPIFIGVQNGAKDASTKSDLTQARLALIAKYNATGTWSAPSTTAATNTTDFANYGWTGTVAATAANQTASTFCLTAGGGTTGATQLWIAPTGDVRTTVCS